MLKNMTKQQKELVKLTLMSFENNSSNICKSECPDTVNKYNWRKELKDTDFHKKENCQY